jgi:hypothetical protein
LAARFVPPGWKPRLYGRQGASRHDCYSIRNGEAPICDIIGVACLPLYGIFPPP